MDLCLLGIVGLCFLAIIDTLLDDVVVHGFIVGEGTPVVVGDELLTVGDGAEVTVGLDVTVGC